MVLSEYTEFISKFNVLGLAIGLMIGSNLKDVAGDFIDDVLMPFVNPVLKKLGTGEKEDEKNGLTFNIPGTDIEINLSKVISSSVKFLMLSVVIFMLMKFGVNLKKPVQWVSVRNWPEMKKVLSK